MFLLLADEGWEGFGLFQLNDNITTRPEKFEENEQQVSD